MEQQELQNQIALYYSKLPPESQKLFSGMNWLQTLQTISQKYNLSEPQIQTLGTETTLVLLGLIPLEEYEQTLKKEISVESINQLMEEVNNQILKSVRPELEQTFKKNSAYQGDEKLDERFANLSEETKKAITSIGYYRTLYEIAQQYKLNVAQMGDLEIVTTNVVTGVIQPEKLELAVKNKVGLPEDKTKELVNALNDRILKKIREKMMVGYKSETPTTLVKLDQLELPRGEKIIPVTAPKAIETKRVEVKSASETPAQAPVPMVKETKPEIHTVFAQKLTDTFQMPKVETNHSLKPEGGAPVSAAPKIDPYREIPE